MRISNRICLWMSLVGLLLALAGCWGVHYPANVPRSTSQFSFEYELIPDAKFMREDIEPDWRLGRHAFAPGADQLLVITRFTSWLDRSAKDEYGNPQRRPQLIERLWVVIPQGTPVGYQMDLEEHEMRFLAGYDEKDLKLKGGPHVYAFRLRGKLTVLEAGEDEALVRVNLHLWPDRRNEWRLDDTVRVPVTRTGIHAQSVSTPDPKPVAPSGTIHLSSGELYLPPPAPEAADNGGAAPAAGEPEPLVREGGAAAEQAIAGQWIADTGTYELRLQFDDNRRFVYSSSRSNYNPGVMYGEYRVRGGHVVMQVERWMFGSVDHLPHLGEDRTVLLRLTREGDDELVLSGDFKQHDVKGTLRFKRAEFADMNAAPPPSRGAAK